MIRHERLRRLGSGLAIATVVAVVYWTSPPGPELLPLQYDPDGTADDLDRDLKLMWETQPGEADPHGPPSTERAVDAASRVFNTLDIRGMAADDVGRRLRAPATPGRVPQGVTVPASAGLMAYRFQSDTRGWLFRLRFSVRERVEAVDRYRLR